MTTSAGERGVAALRARLPSDLTITRSSRTRALIGHILSVLVVAFLALDGLAKVVRIGVMVDGMTKLGYPDSAVRGIGIILVLCLTLYVIPRTAVLGAILLTGYLGGAVATHVRIGSGLLGFVLLPVYCGVIVWGALYLRDPRVRGIIPFRSAS